MRAGFLVGLKKVFSNGGVMIIPNYDPRSHALLEDKVKKGSTNIDVLIALDLSLMSKEALLWEQEEKLWRKIGTEKDFSVGKVGVEYHKMVKSELQAEREKIPEKAKAHLSRASEGQVKLVDSEGTDKTKQWLANPELGIVEISLNLRRLFAEASPAIEKLAAERGQILLQRINLLDGEYRPKQYRLYPRLIVCVDDGKTNTWREYKREGRSRCSETETLSLEQLQKLTDLKEAKRLVKQCYSIMVLKLRQGLDIDEQIQEVVLKHYDRYLKSDRGG